MLTRTKAALAVTRSSYARAGAIVALALAETTAPASANTMATYLGKAGSFFGDFLTFLEGPIAQAVCVMVVIGAIWRLRNNFEWGEAGTVIMLIVLTIGCLALIGSIWGKLGGGSATGWGTGLLF